MNGRGGAQLEEQIELFGKERVVVFQIVTEEREGFGEGPAASDDLGAAAGDKDERSEILEDADGVVGAEHGDGAGETKRLSARGGGGKNYGGSGVEEVVTMMLADTEGIQPGGVGGRDLGQEVAHAISWVGRDAGDRVRLNGDKTVEAKLHDVYQVPQKVCVTRSAGAGAASRSA